MRIHHKLYMKLTKLIPNFQTLEDRDESLLLYAKGQVPVNVMVSQISRERSVLTLCILPFDENGVIVPAPYVEMNINHKEKIAVPTLYADIKLKLVRDELSSMEIIQLDSIIYSWLTMLQKLGFGVDSKMDRESDLAMD